MVLYRLSPSGDCFYKVDRSSLVVLCRGDIRRHFVWLPQSQQTALYDLDNDPRQLNDVTNLYNYLVNQFKEDIQNWRDQYE